jgi:hypothetical protein
LGNIAEHRLRVLATDVTNESNEEAIMNESRNTQATSANDTDRRSANKKTAANSEQKIAQQNEEQNTNVLRNEDDMMDCIAAQKRKHKKHKKTSKKLEAKNLQNYFSDTSIHVSLQYHLSRQSILL